MLLTRRVNGEIDPHSTIVGEVVVEEGAYIEGSTIRGPVVIGSGTRVVNAYVGPFTSIGPDCEISNCEIEGSIVLERSAIRNVDVRIADSLIGREVVVDRSPFRPKATRLMLGDHSVVDIA
jgi:glucose-1-phosphate thymidylyltransferase